jgi:hypothetical protein
MAAEGVFDDVWVKRPAKDHSHNVWDGVGAWMYNNLLFNPGKGALTFELLMAHLREIPKSSAEYVDRTLDLMEWLQGCTFKDFTYIIARSGGLLVPPRG